VSLVEPYESYRLRLLMRCGRNFSYAGWALTSQSQNSYGESLIWRATWSATESVSVRPDDRLEMAIKTWSGPVEGRGAYRCPSNVCFLGKARAPSYPVVYLHPCAGFHQSFVK
jgi:hypothetical protein